MFIFYKDSFPARSRRWTALTKQVHHAMLHHQDDTARNTELSIFVCIPVTIYQYLYVDLYLSLDNIFVLKCTISGGGAAWSWHAGVLVQPRQAPLSGCRRDRCAALPLVGHRCHHCAPGAATPLPLQQVQAILGNIKIYYFYMKRLE